MSHSRLTFLGVATALLIVAGCAGPAWFARGDFPADGKRSATGTAGEMTGEMTITTTTATLADTHRSRNSAAATPTENRSLAQVLDDLERIKDQNPSDFAVIQSAVEDTSNLFPPQYQQTFKDQMMGVALQEQQRQAAPPPIEQPVTQVAPRQVPVLQAAATPAFPSESSVVQASATAWTPAIDEPAPRVIDVSPSPVIANAPAAQTAAVTAQVTDQPSASPAPAAQPPATTQATAWTPTPAEEAAVAEEVGPGQWNREIERALTSLSEDLARPDLDRDEKARLEILRRLLYATTNRRDEAVSPIDELDEDEREYWKHQIHGLLVSLDADGKHPTTRRAALALRDLRTAVDHLSNVSTLDVRNLTFCKEVLSYGEYRVFDSYSFRAKDEVVLYVEVDNFAAHPRGDSFETELHGSYEIVDDAGRRVANVVLPVDKQVSNNRRRDYFIAYLITMPSQIAPGSYRLRLTVEDVIGKKSNQATIDLRIQ